MKYSALSEKQRESLVSYVETRWADLSELQRDAITQIATYLMASNAGGAIAVLSFMGAMKTTTPIVNAPAMLLAFILGLVIVGLARIVAFYRISTRLGRWRTAVQNFYNDKWTWDEVLAHDAAMGVHAPALQILVWAAFACFVVGVSLGIRSLP